MKIELYSDDRTFIITLLQKSHVKRTLDKLKSSSTIHPDNEDFIECEVTIYELEELVGELSYEANHNRNKRIAMRACDIADSLESQLWAGKHAK